MSETPSTPESQTASSTSSKRPKRPWTILGRLAKAVREQNWFAVALEVLIVVLGVVIGFQVNAWGQERADRVREQEYLVQLLADFEQTEEDLEWSLDFAQRRLEQANLLVAAFEGPPADTVGARELAVALGSVFALVDLPIPQDTWADLVSTGRAGLIQNQDVRWAISAFYRTYDQGRAFTDQWIQFVDPFRREVVATLSPALQEAIAQSYVAGEPIPDTLIPPRTSLLQAIRDRPALRETFGDVLTTNRGAVWQYQRQIDDARQITKRLRAEVGDG